MIKPPRPILGVLPIEQRDILARNVLIHTDDDATEHLWSIVPRRRLFNLPASHQYLNFPPIRIATQEIRKRVFAYPEDLPLGPCHLGANWSLDLVTPPLAFSEIMGHWLGVTPEYVEASFRGDGPVLQYPN